MEKHAGLLPDAEAIAVAWCLSIRRGRKWYHLLQRTAELESGEISNRFRNSRWNRIPEQGLWPGKAVLSSDLLMMSYTEPSKRTTISKKMDSLPSRCDERTRERGAGGQINPQKETKTDKQKMQWRK